MTWNLQESSYYAPDLLNDLKETFIDPEENSHRAEIGEVERLVNKRDQDITTNYHWHSWDHQLDKLSQTF